MIIFPSIISKARVRPERHTFETPSLIPDTQQYSEFWKKFYFKMKNLELSSPVNDKVSNYINPQRGYFGYRKHPLEPSKDYFHIGVQLDLTEARTVTPIADGLLEYSGYGAINGFYVLLSHPQIQTEDGYILHSMYCHLKKPLIKFNSYQKMLREISLGSYPLIPVPEDTVLGKSGSSGVVDTKNTAVYLQIDFRKYNEVPISLDPHMVYEGVHIDNSQV